MCDRKLCFWSVSCDGLPEALCEVSDLPGCPALPLPRLGGLTAQHLDLLPQPGLQLGPQSRPGQPLLQSCYLGLELPHQGAVALLQQLALPGQLAVLLRHRLNIPNLQPYIHSGSIT